MSSDARVPVIVEAVRTPMGRYGGQLAALRPDDLAAHVVRALAVRHPAALAEVEDVYFGAANQAGEDNRNVARMAVLLAGLPVEVPGVTVNRLCGSGMEAVIQAAKAIAAGEGEVYVAGGSESMTRAPFVLPKADRPFPSAAEIFNTALGWRMVNPRMNELYPVESLGATAENVAERYGVDRRTSGPCRATKGPRARRTRAGSTRRSCPSRSLRKGRGRPRRWRRTRACAATAAWRRSRGCRPCFGPEAPSRRATARRSTTARRRCC
jgi:hypothetical protein